MRVTVRWVVSALAGLALLLAACGNGSSHATGQVSSPSPTAPPKGVAGSTLTNPQGTLGSQMGVWASKGIKIPNKPGKKRANQSILGSDVSQWQSAGDLSQYNRAFIIIREQYGTASLDTLFANLRDQARAANLPRMFYHYAYPQYNSADSEAATFEQGTDWRAGEGAMLDMEEQYSDPVGWSLQFLRDFESVEHFKPVMYMNVYELYHYDWSPVANNGNGIIVAQWNFNLDAPPTGAFPFAAGKQYSDSEAVGGFAGRVDGDVFYGDATAFQKYGAPGNVPAPGPPPPTPPPSPPPPPPPVGNCPHTVVAGDTLFGLVGNNWPAVAAANGISNPNLIFVGQVINLCPSGGSGGSRCVIVQSGDTLSGLFPNNWPAVARANGIRNPNLIFVGQRICG